MKTIDVKKKKVNAFRKVMCIFWGLTSFAISIGLFFTIVGIPLALFMFMGSFAIIGAASGKYNVKCPSCNRMHLVEEDQEQFECKKCKSTTLINWIK